ncbi:MAG: OmpA family protein, partial [Elusimicrobia bacterium]|nr:OmpA family protein [Elusimicrobiota bacterium]
LSTARATAVLRYLQDNAKVDPSRLVAAGYGEQRPVASNDTPESRALNRRIEIVLVARE